MLGLPPKLLSIWVGLEASGIDSNHLGMDLGLLCSASESLCSGSGSGYSGNGSCHFGSDFELSENGSGWSGSGSWRSANASWHFERDFESPGRGIWVVWEWI